jgi:ubiquinone biosynthesis protein COQ4
MRSTQTIKFKNSTELDLLLDRITRGYRMGSHAKSLLAQKWERDWDKSLTEWRLELGLATNS